MKALLLLTLMAALGAAADRSADVKAAEKAWAAATVAGDEAKLIQILADDLTYTHSTGETDTRDVFISNLKTGVRKYHKVDHEEMDVRLYGNAAVLRATAQIQTSQKGGPVTPAHLRFIHVWIFQNNRWRMVAHQSLRLL